MLPESILGETFLEKYDGHNDPVTVIDPDRNYGVTAPAKHPIYENFRVKVPRFFIPFNTYISKCFYSSFHLRYLVYCLMYRHSKHC